MGRIKAFIVLLFSIAAFFVYQATYSKGLSGTYTICSSGCDYSTFRAAFHDLESKGVSGPVTFNISAGVYPETDTLLSFSGSSATNIVTFNGAGKDSTVMAGQGDWILDVEGVKYVNFRNIKFDSTANAFTLMISTSDHLIIDNCAIVAPILYRSTPIVIGAVNYLNFKNNTITGGANSIVFGSYSSNYSNSYNIFENNFFSGFCKNGILATGSGLLSNNTYKNNIFNYTTCIYAVGINSTNEVSSIIAGNKLFNCGLTVTTPSATSVAPFEVVNNFIIPKDDANALGVNISQAGSNFLMANNTVYEPKNSQINYGVFVSDVYGSQNVRVVNNIFDLENSKSSTGFNGSFLEINGNDYYFGDKGKLSVYINGKGYFKFKDLITQSAQTGYETYASHIKPSYISALDLHLDKDSIAPVGVYADVATDIDGDTRCKINPTAGADEVPNDSINSPKASIARPDSLFNGVVSVFKDSARSKYYTTHKWYLDGQYISDSLFLETALISTPSVKISLVLANCKGQDSVSRVFKVFDAAGAPVTDFKADKYTVKNYDTVQLSDISSNHPSHWKWQVSPSFVYRNGVKRLTYKYVNSSDSSQDPQLKFYFPGTYSICLSSWNTVTGGSLRKGTIMCKTAYIQVNPVTPTLVVDKPDTTFVQVNKFSKAFVKPPQVLVSLDSFRNTLPDTITPAQIAINKLDTIKISYSTSDSKGNRNVVYRWVIIYDTIAPVLSLKGKLSDTISLNQSYTDPGYMVTENYYTGVDVTRTGSFYNHFPSGKAVAAGIFTIIYTATDSSGNKAVKTRYVVVKDTTRPVIVLKGANPDEVEVYNTYKDPGVTATSKWFSDVSVTAYGTFFSTFKNGYATKLGTYSILYVARDTFGNAVSKTRYVNVIDTIPPVISLEGEIDVTLCRPQDYRDGGYEAVDNYWKTLKIDTEGTFYTRSIDTPGIYTIRYKATDSSGNYSYSPYRSIRIRRGDDSVCTGIYEKIFLSRNLFLYPNPSYGNIVLSSSLRNPVRSVISITDEMGKVIRQIPATLSEADPFELDLAGCVPGLYFVNISTADTIVTKKVILVR